MKLRARCGRTRGADRAGASDGTSSRASGTGSSGAPSSHRLMITDPPALTEATRVAAAIVPRCNNHPRFWGRPSRGRGLAGGRGGRRRENMGDPRCGSCANPGNGLRGCRCAEGHSPSHAREVAPFDEAEDGGRRARASGASVNASTRE